MNCKVNYWVQITVALVGLSCTDCGCGLCCVRYKRSLDAAIRLVFGATIRLELCDVLLKTMQF